MSKSYRGWAELEDWPHRAARRQHKRKTEQDWKKEVAEEMAEQTDTTPVYVVRNFWTPANEDYELNEDVHATFTEQNAWDVLASLAEGQGVSLELSATSFHCPPSRFVEGEYYAIITMEVHQ